MYGEGEGQSDLYQNMPNMSMMFMMYTTTFGNGSFMIQPPSRGEIGQGFPSVPYLSVEALLYQQQASNPSTSPVNVMSGTTIGEQVIKGQYTASDQDGTSRYLTGYQANGQGS